MYREMNPFTFPTSCPINAAMNSCLDRQKWNQYLPMSMIKRSESDIRDTCTSSHQAEALSVEAIFSVGHNTGYVLGGLLYVYFKISCKSGRVSKSGNRSIFLSGAQVLEISCGDRLTNGRMPERVCENIDHVHLARAIGSSPVCLIWIVDPSWHLSGLIASVSFDTGSMVQPFCHSYCTVSSHTLTVAFVLG